MKHNYSKLRLSLSYTKPKDGEEKKIDYKLEVLKQNKKNFEELISWHQTEKEFNDVKIAIKMFEERAFAVLYMKSPRDGLRQFAHFFVKDLEDVSSEVVMDDGVKELLASLPDITDVPEVSSEAGQTP